MQPTPDSATILIVDDHAELADNLRTIFEEEGFDVLVASQGVKALALLQSHTVNLIIADIAMPQMNGYQLYQHVQDSQQWSALPFIFLSARTMDSDIRYGKELGVDDYLTKPINAQDLLAVVRGKLRRAQQRAQLPILERAAISMTSDELVLERLRISPAQHQVWMDGQEVHLSAREFTLLLYLAQHVDYVITSIELIRVTHALETDTIEASTLLRPIIRSLRRKLGYPVGDDGAIDTIRSVGYRLVRPV